MQEGEDFVEEDSDLFKQYKSILNSYHSFELFKGRIIRDLMVTGNAYILKQRNLSGEIIGLQPIDPRTISIIANKY